jgi:hypothetical protein
MATPAQVANDMAAQAEFWKGRDANVERCCRDAARVIRALIAKSPVDGRTLYGLRLRLETHARAARSYGRTGIGHSLDRAGDVINELSGWGLRK